MRRHGEYKMPGGKLVVADLEVIEGVLRSVRISGDFFLEPDEALDAIDAALAGQAATASLEALEAAIATGLPPGTAMYGISPGAIATAVRRAVDAGDQP